MNAIFSVFVICVEAIIYLLLYNLNDCTFKYKDFFKSEPQKATMNCKMQFLVR